MWVNYEKIDHLGQGAFGRVKKVKRSKDGEILACKIIDLRRTDISLEEAEKECAIIRRLTHPNIIEYMDYECTPQKVRLFMEYCPSGSLQDYIEESRRACIHIDEILIWKAIGQLGSALRYCHYGIYGSEAQDAPSKIEGWQPVLHRDIKPSNVLIRSIDPDTILVKLADFGFATLVDPERPPSSYIGTPCYQPPEITRSNERGIRWTKSCDIFSLGCSMYTMCALSPPFPYRMDFGNVCENLPEKYSKRLRTCITRCQAPKAEDRYDASDLVWISDLACSEINKSPPKLHPSEEPRSQPKSAGSGSDQPGLEISQNTREKFVVIDETIEEEDDGLQPATEEIPDDETVDEDDIENDDEIAWSQYWRGRAQFEQEKFPEAAYNLQQALLIFQKVHGQEHEDVAGTFYWCGRALHDAKKYVEGEKMFAKAYEIHEKVFGSENKMTARSLLWRGHTEFEQLKYDKAEGTFGEALGLQEKITGREHEDVAECIYWLGLAQSNQSKYKEAEETFTECTAIREKVSGREHADTAWSMYRQGRVQYEQKRYEDAEKTFQESLTIREKLFGRQHKDTAWSIYWVAHTLRSRSRSEEAEKTFVEALEIWEKIYGREHEDCAYCVYFIGIVQYDQQNYVKAEESLGESVELRTKIYGDHEHTATSLYWKGRAQYEQKRYADAEITLEESFSMRKRLSEKKKKEAKEAKKAKKEKAK